MQCDSNKITRLLYILYMHEKHTCVHTYTACAFNAGRIVVGFEGRDASWGKENGREKQLQGYTHVEGQQ